MHEVHRYHDISAGHRVVGHENKCRTFHGHNYRVHFTCVAPTLDSLGRVIDFGEIKHSLCMWLENNWDHRMILWEEDREARAIFASHSGGETHGSVVLVPFNPTAENMAEYLVMRIGPQVLTKDVILKSVHIEETRKCSATYTHPDYR